MLRTPAQPNWDLKLFSVANRLMSVPISDGIPGGPSVRLMPSIHREDRPPGTCGNSNLRRALKSVHSSGGLAHGGFRGSAPLPAGLGFRERAAQDMASRMPPTSHSRRLAMIRIRTASHPALLQCQQIAPWRQLPVQAADALSACRFRRASTPWRAGQACGGFNRARPGRCPC